MDEAPRGRIARRVLAACPGVRVVGVAVAVSVTGTSGCAKPPARHADAVVIAPAALAQDADDALEGTPGLALVLRPRALVRDPLYGPLLRRATTLAAARARATGVGTTALAVLERADEVGIVAYDHEGAPDAPAPAAPAPAAPADLLLLVRGVPAEVDAARVVDAAGQPVWRLVRTEGGVSELEAAAQPGSPDAANSPTATLFVLPRRAWVIAFGQAVPRARAVYFEREAPRPHDPLPVADETSLIHARLAGAALVRRELRLRVGPLAPLGRELDTVDLTLLPYKGVHDDAWRASVVYGSVEAAEGAEALLHDILEAFMRAKVERHRWLTEILVTRLTVPEASRSVEVHGSLPRGWIEGLLEAGDAEVPVEGGK